MSPVRHEKIFNNFNFFLFFSLNVNSQEMYSKCERIKGMKWHNYFTINPSKNFAKSTAYGPPNDMEKGSLVYKRAYMKERFFIWGSFGKDKGMIFIIIINLT